MSISNDAADGAARPRSTRPRSIQPGEGVIGMIGGGQLGRYTLIAARQMGYRTIVLDPDHAAPAGAIADRHIVAAYDDPAAIDELAAACDVVTAEFENPPAATLTRLSARTLVAPNARAFEIAQDRIREKTFCDAVGAATGPWWPLRTDADLIDIAQRDEASTPLIVKTARMGYDGKGQIRIGGASELGAAWEELDRVACTVEVALDLIAEVSVIVARTNSGDVARYPVTENHHRDGILDLSIAPARIAAAVADSAVELADTIATELDYVGVLAVEFFVVATDDGTGGHRVLVNEIAPRPHNSGHWTLNAAACSQFEQQVRAVCGLALGSTSLTQPGVAMANVLGDLWADGEPNWCAAIHADSALHLYGKAEPRPGRKMGHLTVWGELDTVADTARRLRSALLPSHADYRR